MSYIEISKQDGMEILWENVEVFSHSVWKLIPSAVTNMIQIASTSNHLFTSVSNSLLFTNYFFVLLI